MHKTLRNQVVDMYLQGYSIKYIINYVYKKMNRNLSKRYDEEKSLYFYQEYSRDYCSKCVYDTVLEINSNLKYIV